MSNDIFVRQSMQIARLRGEFISSKIEFYLKEIYEHLFHTNYSATFYASYIDRTNIPQSCMKNQYNIFRTLSLQGDLALQKF